MEPHVEAPQKVGFLLGLHPNELAVDHKHPGAHGLGFRGVIIRDYVGTTRGIHAPISS